MPLEFTYSDPQGIEEPAVAVSLSSNSVRFGTLQLAEAAALGEAGTSGLEVDDPDGTWDFVGLRQLLVRETSAPSNNQIVLSGVIQDRKVSRDDSMLTGAARRWSIDLSDYNWHLGKRIHVDSDAKRPAETAGDRLRWLLSKAANISTYSVNDFGNVTYPTHQVDAADYRGQRPTDLLADCAVEGGYNFWVAYNEAARKPELFFMHPGSIEYTADVAISNDLDDVDSVLTFAPSDAELTRSPSRIAFGVYLAYSGGSVYVRNDTTGQQFAKIDQAAPMSNVKTAARARRVANKFLADNNAEDDKITCSITVPAEKVNHVRVGQLIFGKFTHFPGYEDAQPLRVLRRTVIQDSESGAYQGGDNEEAWYRIALELSPPHDYPQEEVAPPASCGIDVGDGFVVSYPPSNPSTRSSYTTGPTLTLTNGKQYRLAVQVDAVIRARPEAYTLLSAAVMWGGGTSANNWEPDGGPAVSTYPIAPSTVYSDWHTYTGVSQTGWLTTNVGTVWSPTSSLGATIYIECV